MGRARSEAGFTLVEVLISIVVLVFGLIAVTNMFLIAATSNQVGNHSTAATTHASEVMERLKAVPFQQVTVGGNLDADVGTANCTEPATDCVIPGNFNAVRRVPGVGLIRTRWTIVNPGAGGVNVLFITVRSESVATMARQRSRSEYTTFRACTVAGCPT